ncbi:hypothetical protein D6B98_10590 [Bradyrhizobium sp. LVM 105]|nr:hypothetical protein D6B98_10590 [Bradyrhizobium sp. LVM 105]
MLIIPELLDAATNKRAAEVYSFAPRLCEFDGEGASIISAVPAHESDGTTSIGAFFKPPGDAERYPPPTRPRSFEILDFAALRLMASVCAPNTGQGFFYQTLPAEVDGTPKYYLRWGNGGREAGARVYVTRILIDASAGEAARFAEEHHSYRRSDLLSVAQRNPRLAEGEHGREQAIRLAVQLFTSNAAITEGVSAAGYEEFLRGLLTAADAFHTVIGP